MPREQGPVLCSFSLIQSSGALGPCMASPAPFISQNPLRSMHYMLLIAFLTRIEGRQSLFDKKMSELK